VTSTVVPVLPGGLAAAASPGATGGATCRARFRRRRGDDGGRIVLTQLAVKSKKVCEKFPANVILGQKMNPAKIYY
jgi:hypothetical protein